jgi:hypothetical protein
MTYTVTEGNVKWVIKVDYETYPDYFDTTGGDRLKVFDNGKSTCTVTNLDGD